MVEAFRAWGRPVHVNLLLAGVGIIAVFFFMTSDAKGSWEFVLSFRGRKLWGLVLVAAAIGISTVLFQTISENRILTPAVMGFDALYRLIQTLIVFFAGSASIVALDVRFLFVAQAAIMVVFALLLFQFLFVRSNRHVHTLILAGFIFGALFRSLSDFLQRLIDPNEFVVLQDRTFARFSAIDEQLLLISTIIIAALAVWALALRHKLDVVALGKEASIILGVDHRRFVNLILVIVALLVSVSTALVGPVTFFGLLVANLAYVALGSEKHEHTLIGATLVGVVSLVLGQLILERIFEFNTSLSIIIEFVGGIAFIALLIRRVRN